MTKETRAASALYYPVTASIPIAAALGIDHQERATLSLALCARWGGIERLSPPDQDFLGRLRSILGAQLSWWAEALGRVCRVIAELALVGGYGDAGMSLDVESTMESDKKSGNIWVLRLWHVIEGAGVQDVQENKAEGGAAKDGNAAADTRNDWRYQPSGGDDATSTDSDDDDEASHITAPSSIHKAIKSLHKLGKEKNCITTRRSDGTLETYGRKLKLVIM